MHRLLRNNKQIILFSTIGAVGFIIDRVLKSVAEGIGSEGVRLFGEWAKFKLYMNDAMAFSLPVSVEITRLLSAVIFLVVGYLAIRAYATSQKQAGALVIVLFGALSNLIDRFYFGYVVDYIDLWSYSMFNLADVLVGIGLVMVLFIRVPKNAKT